MFIEKAMQYKVNNMLSKQQVKKYQTNSKLTMQYIYR